MANPSPSPEPVLPVARTELVAMLVAMTAIVALSVDLMLPALGEIASDLGAAQANDRQYIVTLYLAGFGLSQLVYGPLSDRFGRKIVTLWALGFFVLFTLACALTQTFSLFLALRFAQGAAAAASRVLAVAILRDLMAGRRMAEVMSIIMAAFMAVPVIAPAIGQLILGFAPWQVLFLVLMAAGLGLMAWLYLRLPETLHPQYRIRLNLAETLHAFADVLQHRVMLGYTLAGAAFFSGLYGFLGSSQQIFAGHFALGPQQLPLAFAAAATGMGLASYANSRIVMRLGQRRVSHGALMAFGAVSLLHLLVLLAGIDNLIVFLILLTAAMSFIGLLFGNFSALAMEPVGHVAGTASTVYGFLTAVIGSLGGMLIGQLYDGTALPLIAGQTCVAVIGLAIVFVTERGHMFQEGADD
ncbi:MAG: DHA1 family bicyclomycin/chloramphenicol resistance-like MFS transporter [Maricaulis sp.]|jgi:DHA1 family bicyclomycin/chloramphenicol resistance-like MFS transporter